MPKPSKAMRLRLKRGAAKPQKVRLPLKSQPAGKPPREGSKLAKVLALLKRPEGASIGELVHATGWREHSVRAAITTVKERQGVQVTSVKSHDRLRRYYVTVPGTADQLPKGNQ